MCGPDAVRTWIRPPHQSNALHFDRSAAAAAPPVVAAAAPAASGPHFYTCIGGQGAGAVNWTPFDMSVLQVRYPMQFFY